MEYIKPRVLSFSKEDIKNNMWHRLHAKMRIALRVIRILAGRGHDFIASSPDEII